MTNNKKAFTLIEIIVSIGLFSIVILFLYETFDMTKNTDKFYNKKLEDITKSNHIKKTLFLDFMQKDQNSTIDIAIDRENNNIVQVQTTNYYHNPFFTNITYLVTKEKNLLRVESLDKFNKQKLNDQFFDNAYIDILDKNITKFKASKNNENVFFYILKENGDKILFNY